MPGIIPKHTPTPGKVPTAAQLAEGELAVNTADGLLFTKHSDGSVKTLNAGGGGGSAYSPDWVGVLYAARADCDPIKAANLMDTSAAAAPTPTAISTAIARAVKFRVPKAMTATKVYLFGIAATTNLYKFAIYNASTGARVWESGTVTTAANAWLTLNVTGGLALATDTEYWFCVTAAATGTTAGFRSPLAPIHANQYGAAASPLGNSNVGLPVYAQFAVSGGVFPATLPTLAAAAYAGGTTGSVPFAFLAP